MDITRDSIQKPDAVQALGALAQEHRIDIFRFLVERGSKGSMVGTIGKKLGLAHATLSFHLDKLRQSGLIESERRGRARIYRTNYDIFVGVIRYLTENCCKECDMDCSIEIKTKRDSTHETSSYTYRG